MNPDDPTPLASQDADPFVHALLRAGRRERAPRGAQRRLIAVLGIGGAAGSAGLLGSLARLSARLGPKGLVTSTMLMTAAVGIAVYGFFGPSRHALAPSAPSSPATVTAPEPHPAQPVQPMAAPSAELPVTRIEDLPSSASAPAAAPVPSTRPASAAASTADGEPASSLAREVALIEAARVALARGDAAGALRSLDIHDRELPAGTLMPESRVLRIEALVRAGGDSNLARASALGDAFLAANPGGPQARRVRAVLERSP